MAESIFAEYEHKGYPYRFKGHIAVDLLAGGTPSDPKVAEGWIKGRGYKGDLKDQLLVNEVAKIMEERGITEEQAIEQAAQNRHLIGFKRDENGLYVEGRHLKACLKEAVSIAADVGKIDIRGFGANKKKGVRSFVAEHIFVVERKLHLGVTEPTEVLQSFIHTFRGDGIQYSEMVEGAEFDFTVETDHDFGEEFWAQTWLTAQREGVGAMRSQGYGQFKVTAWEPVANGKVTRRKAA